MILIINLKPKNLHKNKKNAKTGFFEYDLFQVKFKPRLFYDFSNFVQIFLKWITFSFSVISFLREERFSLNNAFLWLNFTKKSLCVFQSVKVYKCPN